MNKTLGIVGGGQLAMMMTQAAYNLGVKQVIVLDPTPKCPATKVGAIQIVGSFNDRDRILELAKKVDVMTFDLEGVNVDALIKVSEMIPVYPDPTCLKTIQDKWVQRVWLLEKGIPEPKFCTVKDVPLTWNKFVVKCRKGGYDGKGVWIMNNKTELCKFIHNTGMKEEDLYVEEYIECEKELAIQCFQSNHHRTPITYPIVETVQNKDNICASVICPTPLDHDIHNLVNSIAKDIISNFNTYGIFTIELFLTKDKKLFVNELSPRVHNSGHYTIEGTNCSQFEQHIRCVLGMKTIVPTLVLSPIKMVNILANGNETDIIDQNRTGMHWYNKERGDKYKVGRKIGHYTYQLPLEEIPFPVIYIVMGSSSDRPTLQPAIDLLNEYKIPNKVDVVSAHRSPEWMFEFGKNVESWCGRVVIAAAGGAAHLPGMLASLTNLPVIGVPVPSKYLRGQDSLYSIVEMPDGVPVATVGIGKAKNAAILALRIIGANEVVKQIREHNQIKVDRQRVELENPVLDDLSSTVII